MESKQVSTYIVAGPPYTGTSLVAGTLHLLGINMGRRFKHKGTYEDVDFFSGKTETELYDSIWKRNQKYTKWGFKYPLFSNYMWIIGKHLKNPKVIMTYRSFTDYTVKYPKNKEMIRYLKEYGVWGAFLEVYQWELLVVDYHQAIENKDYLIDLLVPFCDLQPTKKQIKLAKEFNTGGTGYKKISKGKEKKK